MSEPWDVLLLKVGLVEANEELDKRTKVILNTLRDITSVVTNDNNLTERIQSLRQIWFPAKDQYARNVLHLAALSGNTRLVRSLVYSGAKINERDGIGQTPLTLALHKGHLNAAKFLLDEGASVDDRFHESTVALLEIAKTRQDETMENEINMKLSMQHDVYEHISSSFKRPDNVSAEMECAEGVNFARVLDINVGDQKNTVTLQTCANRCPDKYGTHVPGGGDFHNRGYINESIARIAGHGGFWNVTEKVMKRPTVNPSSFKLKFKDNNYNNNEEALLDYDEGLSIAMIKTFQNSTFFPSEQELKECLKRNGNHHEVLLEKLREWTSFQMSEDAVFSYHTTFINDLMPITKWYRESVRYGNGLAIEGVWMLCPPLYVQVGKTNYRDEAFTQCVNALAKLPLAYRKMYQQNRTVNLQGKQGRQLAGDEWVEDFLVCPVKQYACAQSSFAMVELMSCSVNLLEMNRTMYKSREAFNIHNTRKHQVPSSKYDQLKVAQFALKEDWFECKGRDVVLKYPWGDVKCKEAEAVPSKYIKPLEKGNEKAEKEFKPFLHRKFPNELI